MKRRVQRQIASRHIKSHKGPWIPAPMAALRALPNLVHLAAEL